MEKRNNTFLGIIFILLGIFVFLRNTDIFSGNIFLILVGLIFLAIYFTKKYTWSLIVGLMVMVTGITSVVDDYFTTTIDISGFTFLFGLGLAFLILYFVKGITGFVFPGFFLIAIGVYTLVSSMYDGDLSWLFFLLIGLAFYGIYLAEFRKMKGVYWPLIPGTISICFSAFLFLLNNQIIKNIFLEIKSYILPVSLIIVGILIIFSNSRHRVK